MSLYEITNIKEYDEKTDSYYGSKDAYFNKVYCNKIFTNQESISTSGFIKNLTEYNGYIQGSTYNNFEVLTNGVSKYNIPSNLIGADSIIQIKYSFYGDGFTNLQHSCIIRLGDNNDIFPDNSEPTTYLLSTSSYYLDVCFTIYIKSRIDNLCTAIVEGSIMGSNIVSGIKARPTSFNIDPINGLSYNIIHNVRQTNPNNYSFNRGVVIVQKLQ